MTFAPEQFFVIDSLVPGEGWQDTNAMIREADGRYRLASGAELAAIQERFPGFARKTLDEGFCEECGARQIAAHR